MPVFIVFLHYFSGKMKILVGAFYEYVCYSDLVKLYKLNLTVILIIIVAQSFENTPARKHVYFGDKERNL